MRLTLAVPTALALLLGATPALAVHGDQSVRSIQGERANRLESPQKQRAWARQAGWLDFQERRGGQWTARWDDETGTPVRFYGTGWDVDAAALRDDVGAFEVAEKILAEEAALLGRDVHPGDLERLVVDRTDGITTVTFQQHWLGIRVDETRLSLRFKAGRFVMGQIETAPVLAGVPTTPQVTRADALQAAIAGLGWDSADRVYSSELVILPIHGETQLDARLAWRFDLTSAAERSHPIAWVDAVGGRLIGWEQQIRYAGGTILGDMDNRYPENGGAQLPLVFADLGNEDGDGNSDANAVFSLPGDAPDTVTFEVGSEFFRIESDGGETEFSSQLSSDGGTVVVEPDSSAGAGAQRRQRAELDIHTSAHIARERAMAIHPTFQWGAVQARVNVNVSGDSCGAWFDVADDVSNSNVNFLRQGGGCNNMGRVFDVMHHEYGHGFHIWSIVFGAGDFDGALSEGLSDYMSATINDDSAVGRGFFQGDSSGRRDIEPNRAWPDDISQDIHITGLIIAGALWDLRTALIADQGEAGLVRADELFKAVAQRASDVPTGYEETLLGDDDNGNLADGTPNECFIDEAFALHGLGPRADDAVQFGVEFDEPGPLLAPGEGVDLSLRAFRVNTQCAEGAIEDVRLRWSVDNAVSPDQFDDLGFTALGGDDWEVSIPALSDGSYLRYLIEVIDDSGDVVRSLPEGSATDPWYGAWVGGEPLWEDDFEDGDGGFDSALIEGGDQEGANDWMRETPKGDGGDPNGAASGDFAWGNDLQPEEDWNGEYQNEVHNVLRSGRIEVGDGPVHLQFRRWLTVEDGLFDRAWVEVNGTLIWENIAGANQNDASSHHEDTHWAFRSYDVTDLVDEGAIEVEWHLETDQGLTMGGWTIDDVRVLASEGGEVLGSEGSACACSSGTPTSAPWSLSLLLLGAAGVRARRRRR